MKRSHFRLGWLVAVVMLTALACTCGPLNQATQGVQTAQALASQAQGLATKVEQSGFLKTAEAAASQAATSGVLKTLEAGGTQGGLGQVPDDIPVYSDHSQVVAFSGTIGYQAKADLKTVTEFYQTEMVNNGWEQAQDP